MIVSLGRCPLILALGSIYFKHPHRHIYTILHEGHPSLHLYSKIFEILVKGWTEGSGELFELRLLQRYHDILAEPDDDNETFAHVSLKAGGPWKEFHKFDVYHG